MERANLLFFNVGGPLMSGHNPNLASPTEPESARIDLANRGCHSRSVREDLEERGQDDDGAGGLQ